MSTEEEHEDCVEGLGCPECGGHVAMYPDCPGYMQDGRVYVCQPCGNGWTYSCAHGSCIWAFQQETIDRGAGRPLRSGFSLVAPVEAK